MQPRWIWLLLLIASSLHQGCATGRFQSIYDEAPGDRSSSIAVIVPPTVKVLAVDGHAINHRSLLTFATGQAVFLKPGNHSMSVQYAT
ncbi:MAG: hypothetical protein O3A51_11685, partial [Verrucomicrobia bacterium]|nr:hypothetical protein [Verrucomicrobiota bacterium]